MCDEDVIIISMLFAELAAACRPRRRPVVVAYSQLTLELPAEAPLSVDRTSVPAPSYAADIDAFQALSRCSEGTAERALFALLTRHGMAGTCGKLDQDNHTVLGWVRAGAVPPALAPLVLWAARGLKTYQGQRGVDPRRREVAALLDEARRAGEARLPVLEIAAKVGVSRQTVRRWATQEPKRLGRPRKATSG